MKTLFMLLAVVLITDAFSQGEISRIKHYNVKDGLALQGYDPVSYFSGKPTLGNNKVKFVYMGVTYFFSSYANLSSFKLNPGKYEPAYGGWCAYAMGATGEKVKVDPETYQIIDGRLYLFYNFWGNNTLKDWNKNLAELKKNGDRNWSKFI